MWWRLNQKSGGNLHIRLSEKVLLCWISQCWIQAHYYHFWTRLFLEVATALKDIQAFILALLPPGPVPFGYSCRIGQNVVYGWNAMEMFKQQVKICFNGITTDNLKLNSTEHMDKLTTESISMDRRNWQARPLKILVDLRWEDIKNVWTLILWGSIYAMPEHPSHNYTKLTWHRWTGLVLERLFC